MTIAALGEKLAEMYARKGENQSTMIHLFGVLYAGEIEASKASAGEVVRAAGLPESYKTEVRKGMNLSKFVRLRDEYKGKF